MTSTMRFAAALAAAMSMAACGELPQDGPKPFVAADEIRSHAAPLADRTMTQDEYPALQRAGTRAGSMRTAASAAQ